MKVFLYVTISLGQSRAQGGASAGFTAFASGSYQAELKMGDGQAAMERLLSKRMSRLEVCNFCGLKSAQSMKELAKGGTLFKFLEQNKLMSGDLFKQGKACYHLACAILSPDVFWNEDEFGRPIRVGRPLDELIWLETTIKRAKKIKCKECGKPGATISCESGGQFYGQYKYKCQAGLMSEGGLQLAIQGEEEAGKKKSRMPNRSHRKPQKRQNRKKDSKRDQVLDANCDACQNPGRHRAHAENCSRSLYSKKQNQKKQGDGCVDGKRGVGGQRVGSKRPRPCKRQDGNQVPEEDKSDEPAQKRQRQKELEEIAKKGQGEEDMVRDEKKQDVGDQEKSNSYWRASIEYKSNSYLRASIEYKSNSYWRASFEYTYNGMVPEDVTLTDGLQDFGRNNLPLPDSVPRRPIPTQENKHQPNPEREFLVLLRSDRDVQKVLKRALKTLLEILIDKGAPVFPRDLKVILKLVSKALGGPEVSDEAVNEVFRERSGSMVMFGEFLRANAGLCRHRAILFKFLFDNLKLHLELWKQLKGGCRLVRGMLEDDDGRPYEHAWNIVCLGEKYYQYYLVDAMNGKVFQQGQHDVEIAKYGRGSKGDDGGAGMASVVGPHSHLDHKIITNPQGLHLFERNPENIPRSGGGEVNFGTLDNKKVVVKRVERPTEHPQQLAHLQEEAKFYLDRKLNHVNIPVLLAVLTDDRKVPAGGQCYTALILEQHTELNLQQWITRRSSDLDLDLRLFILFQVALALEFMHSNKYIHRDVKPENVIVHENMRAQVIDFGLAREASSDGNTIQTQNAGYCTPQYAAPEQLANWRPCTTKIDLKVDVFAFGLLVFFVVTGEHFHEHFMVKNRTSKRSGRKIRTWSKRSGRKIEELIRENIKSIPSISTGPGEMENVVNLISQLVFLCVGGKNKGRYGEASDHSCDRPTMEEVLSMMKEVQDFRNLKERPQNQVGEHQQGLQNRVRDNLQVRDNFQFLSQETQYESDAQSLPESLVRGSIDKIDR
eukprot:g36463.t1